jgi:hypothetical protein
MTPNIEPKERYLVSSVTGMKTTAPIRADTGAITERAPKPVAIPLPPLKLRNIGQL